MFNLKNIHEVCEGRLPNAHGYMEAGVAFREMLFRPDHHLDEAKIRWYMHGLNIGGSRKEGWITDVKKRMLQGISI